MKNPIIRFPNAQLPNKFKFSFVFLIFRLSSHGFLCHHENIKQRKCFDEEWNFVGFAYPFHDQRAIALAIVVGRGWKWSIWRAATLCARTGRRTVAGEETSRPVREIGTDQCKLLTTVLLSFQAKTKLKLLNEIKMKSKSTREGFANPRNDITARCHSFCYSQWLWRIARKQSSIVSRSIVGLVRLAVRVWCVNRIERVHRLIVVVVITARRWLFSSSNGCRLRSVVARRCLRLRLWLLGRDSQFI